MHEVVIATTDRLILRQLSLSDVDALNQVYGDPEVMQFSGGIKSADWVRGELDRCLHDYRTRGFGLWAVVQRDCEEVIGYCGLTYFPNINGRPEFEIGYRLARQHWGQGFATEAALAVRDYAFHTLDLPRLIALIDPGNVASIRVAEKIGMHHESDVMLTGYDHPDRVYSIPRPEKKIER